MDEAIAGLERIAAEHWRAPERARLGSWLLRAAAGFTGRANSALPLGDPGMPLARAASAVTAWYRERGLRPMIVVPAPLDGDGGPLEEYLAGQGWTERDGAAVVMTAGIEAIPAGSGPGSGSSEGVRLDAEPDAAWCALYQYRGQALPPVARELLLSAPWQAFGSIRAADGSAVAVGRVSVTGQWATLTAIEVDAARRRSGLGTAITSALCREAGRRGASLVLLQTETGNAAARALYERCGFTLTHRYHYRMAPGAG